MKLTNILQVNQILSKVKTTSDFQLDWKIADYICSSKQHIDFYNSKISELLEQYGERNEDGSLIYADNGIRIKPDATSMLSEKINELNSVEIDFNFSLTYDEVAKCNFDIQDLVFLKQNLLSI